MRGASHGVSPIRRPSKESASTVHPTQAPGAASSHLGAPAGRSEGARRARAGRWRLAAVGIVWAATLALVLQRELASRRASADVRELLKASRLERAHASARYAVRMGETDIGRLSSTLVG